MEIASFASNTTVNSGGSLWLESDYAILEGTTLIKTGATVNAVTGVITNNGILDYDLDAGASRTESNSIQGIGSLQKTGQGTLLLTGNNTYAGDTLVDEGTLWLADSAVIGVPTVSGSSSQLMAYLPSGSVSVAAGATLGGTGVINDDVSNAGNIAISQSNETGHTLTINGNYTGNNGTLSLNTQLGDDASPTDKLLISGDTAGTTTVFVTNTGGDGALTTQGIEVIDVGGQSDGVFTQGNQVQVGLYEYRLYQDGGDWYLRSQTVTPVNPDDGGDVTPVNPDDGGNAVPVNPQYRADIGAYLGNQWMARNLQMQTLYDREGSQLRTDDGSMWMRFKAGDASSQAANGHVDIDNNYSQLQIGGDILSWDDSVQSLKAGLMVSYINADTDSTGNRGADGSQFSASGNVAGYNLGAYATWFADVKDHSGLYVDSWYQYGLYNNSVNNGDVGSKDYDSTASAVSLETGYRYDIGLENLNTVSLTPQAQVTWQQYKADAVVQNGTRIDGQNGDSWNTRLGLRVDGKLHKNTTSVIQPFAEVNWLHTSDDVAVSFDGAQVKQDLPADRAEVKVGIQANLNSQWSITGQVAGQKGRNDYGDLNGSLDVRYSW
ncbi:autotransporter outer membrane beta-barrel domain-containing protein [Citrobacter youngae]|nr:autotransporter outer membrane beta-barrel domain-containing protein [Citrobacter youngae]